MTRPPPRGPLRAIKDVTPIETDGRGHREAELDLTCGHTVIRLLRKRHKGPDPGRARCHHCPEG